MVPPKPKSIPPPSNWAEVVLPLPIVMFLSPMFRVAESIDVVVPETSKLPPTFTLPVVVTLAKFTLSVVPTLWFPNEPLMSDAIWAEELIIVLDSSVSAVVILVEKLPLSICKLSTFVSSVVILELNEPLSVCKFVILVSSVVSLVDNLLLKSLD